MKRQFYDQGKDSELTDDESNECLYDFDPKDVPSSAFSPPLVNSCCRKCKQCNNRLSSLNPRHSDVALRLKEKTKKKKEAAEKGINQSAQKDSGNGKQQNLEEATMNLDDSDENISNTSTVGSGNKPSKLRSSSNNSSISNQALQEFFENHCTLQVDCRCKNCQKRKQIGEELIAEEESSKKKKAKKKKKKNAKKNQDTEEDQEDDAKPDTEDEDSHEQVNNMLRSANSGVVDPTSVEINQWIKVKNKYNASSTYSLKSSVAKSPASSRSTISSFTVVSQGSQDHQAEMESNGFKLIGGKDSAEKRKGLNLDGITKDFDALALSNFKNTPAAMEKARLLSIDANMAYLRGELSYAIKLISESIECDDKSPENFINRSFYYEKNKNYLLALNDAEKAIKLDEVNEDFLEHSLYRKAKALSGLNRFPQVEATLQSIIKLLSKKCKSDVQTLNSFVIKIEKDLMINRLKKLVLADYTLPLARLYALKFDSLQVAVDAIAENIRLLDGANENSLDLKLHLQLINGQLQKDFSSDSELKDAKLLSLIKAPKEPFEHTQSSTPRRLSNTSSNQDLWNFNENDEDINSGTRLKDLLRDAGDEQKIDEETFLSEYDDDDDDSEIYLSDEDEYEMVYSNPEKWNSPKDILQLNTAHDNFFTDELREPINSNGQKALWIGNVSPDCSQNLVSHVFMKFGSVTFCNIFPNERTNEIAYLLLHYDNDISPRLVTAYFKDQVVPKISKDSLPLIIRFRNKNDKGEEGDGVGGFASLPASAPKSVVNSVSSSPQSPSHHLPTLSNGTAPNKQPSSECYYWRTTGCDREKCSYLHIKENKGIDKKSWMRRKN